MAVDELKEKVTGAFYALKRTIPYEISIRTWRKILDSVLNPIVFYGGEVWDPSSNQDFTRVRSKFPIETLQK